ncbi:MAG TPA: acyltransferase [bacterium]|nr:acyltransferase [bacterium]
MGFLDKLRFVTRMMSDRDVDELYRELKQGALRMAAEPVMHWWFREAAFLHAHSFEAAVEKGMKVGKDPRIEPGVILMGHHLISIGDHFVCSAGVNIRAVNARIVIGNQVSIGPYAALIGANHGIKRGMAIQDQPQESGEIVIGDDVWIAAGAVILPGVHLGNGSVVAAGAVVSIDVPEMTVVAGVPAARIRER